MKDLGNQAEAFPTHATLATLKILWNIDNLCFVRKMENIVFSAARDDQRVYLRLTSPLRRPPQQISAELFWLKYLHQNGLPVVQSIAAPDGRTLVTVQQEDTQFTTCLFAEVSGIHPTLEQAKNPHFQQQLGGFMAQMHEASLTFKGRTPTERREEWHNERGIRHAQEAAACSSNDRLRSKFQSLCRDIAKFSRDEQSYGLVHLDWNIGNLFCDATGTTSLIDFDDSCYHFFSCDLATFACSLAGRLHIDFLDPQISACIEQLLQGYCSVRPFPQKIQQHVPLFMNFLGLRVYFWIEYHQKIGSFLNENLELMSQIKIYIEQQIR